MNLNLGSLIKGHSKVLHQLRLLEASLVVSFVNLSALILQASVQVSTFRFSAMVGLRVLLLGEENVAVGGSLAPRISHLLKELMRGLSCGEYHILRLQAIQLVLRGYFQIASLVNLMLYALNSIITNGHGKWRLCGSIYSLVVVRWEARLLGELEAVLDLVLEVCQLVLSLRRLQGRVFSSRAIASLLATISIFNIEEVLRRDIDSSWKRLYCASLHFLGRAT